MRWECLGEKREKYREGDRVKWVLDRTGSLNSASSKSWQMQISRGIEISVEGGVEKMVVNSWGIEEVSRNNPTELRTEAQSIHQVSRSYRGCRAILDQSTRYRAAVEIAIKKAEEARQTARYRGGVEPAFKNSFSRCEKHRHECNPTCNSTNDPINTIISQNSLSI